MTRAPGPVGPAAAACLFSLVALAGVAACTAEEPATGEDEEVDAPLAPDFTLPRLDGGEPVTLSSLRGRTVVLDFWATWCAPCELQVPELNRLYDAHRADSDVAIFGISIDVEGADVVGAWVAEKGVRYPILLGGEDLARRYGAVGFPTTYVVDPAGRIRAQHSGLTETATLEEAIAEQRAADSS